MVTEFTPSKMQKSIANFSGGSHTETDLWGERDAPANKYYGIETLR